MTPEQFAWSLMQATGLIAAEQKAQGAKPNEAAVYAKLSGQAAPFVALFGTQPGDPAFNQEFEATLDQTLFLTNGGTLRVGWPHAPAASWIAWRRNKDAGAIAEDLYLGVLTRLPTAEDRRKSPIIWSAPPATAAALQDLAWALLTSAEFRFNR